MRGGAGRATAPFLSRNFGCRGVTTRAPYLGPDAPSASPSPSPRPASHPAPPYNRGSECTAFEIGSARYSAGRRARGGAERAPGAGEGVGEQAIVSVTICVRT